MNDRFGPQTADITRFVEQLQEAYEAGDKGVWEEQAALVDRARRETRGHEWFSPWFDAWEATWAAMGESKRVPNWDAVEKAVHKVVWYTAPEGAWDALLALLVRDLITPEQFELLYAPWKQVMEER